MITRHFVRVVVKEIRAHAENYYRDMGAGAPLVGGFRI
jgi:hypothetical protein